MSSKNKPSLDTENAFIKASAYCIYRDRCTTEMIAKLKEWNTNPAEITKIIARLVKEHFIDEERFACSFARGKFRINKWGKIKISAMLKMKGIPASIIKKALCEIDDEEYLKTLKNILAIKSRDLKGKDIQTRYKKLVTFAISKGYETQLIIDILET